MMYALILAEEIIHDGAPDGGTLDACGKADALRRGIGTLVELTGKVFDGKDDRAVRRGQFAVGQINLRFGKNGWDALIEDAFLDALNIITVDDPKLFEGGNAEKIADVVL